MSDAAGVSGKTEEELRRMSRELMSNADRVIRDAIHEMEGAGRRGKGGEEELRAYVARCVKDRLSACAEREARRLLLQHAASTANSSSVSPEVVSDCVSRIVRESEEYQELRKTLLACLNDPQVLQEEEEEEDGPSPISWELLSSDRLVDMADAVCAKDDDERRFTALRMLSALPLAEVVATDGSAWPRIRMGLTGILVDDGEDDRTFRAALQMQVNLLLHHLDSGLCTSEGYGVMLEALSSCSQVTRSKRALQLAKLTNAFQKAVPSHWIRYPEEHRRRLAHLTVQYLFPPEDVPKTALHILSLVDPRAEWFSKWTSGECGRANLFQAFEAHPDPEVLSTLMTHCICLLASMLGSLETGPEVDDIERATKAHVDYCFLLHLASILGILLRTSRGQRLLAQGPTEDFLHLILDASFRFCSGTALSECNPLCFGRVTASILVGHLQATELPQRRLELLHLVARPFEVWLQLSAEEASRAEQCQTHTWLHVADVFQSLQCSSLEELIVSFTERLLLLVSGQEEVKTAMVQLSCSLLSMHASVQQTASVHRLLRAVAEEWESRMNEDEESPGWLESLARVGMTPLGLHALQQADLLQDVLDWAEKDRRANSSTGISSDHPLLLLSQVAAQQPLTNHLLPFIEEDAEALCEAIRSSHLSGEGLKGRHRPPPSEERLRADLLRMLNDLVLILPTSPKGLLSLLPSSTVLLEGEAEQGMDVTIGPCPAGHLSLLLSWGLQSATGHWWSHPVLASEMGLCLLVSLSSILDIWLHWAPDDLQVGRPEVVDRLWLLRRHVALKVSEIGGESEKRMPPFSVFSDDDDHGDNEGDALEEEDGVDFLVRLPAPPATASEDIEAFLKESELPETVFDQEWLSYCAELFRSCIISQQQLRGRWFGRMMFHAAKAISSPCPSPMQITTGTAAGKSKVQLLGSQMIIRYGFRLGVLQGDHTDLTDRLLQSIAAFENDNEDRKNGFDWLTAICFLLQGGDPETTTLFRRKLVSLLPLPNGQPQRPPPTTTSPTKDEGANPWLTFCHNVGVILNGDLPLVFNALQRCGVCVGEVCHPWLHQLFLNVLDWEQICHFIGLTLLLGRDFPVYFIVALLRHLQTNILRWTNKGNMLLCIRESRLEGFRTRDYLPFMDHLESKYRGDLLRSPPTPTP